MKHLLLVLLFALISCTTTSQPKPAFLPFEEVSKLPKKDCTEFLDPYIRETTIPFVDSGMTANKQALYFIFANEKEGILIHLANPGYDWATASNFEKSKYLGYCFSAAAKKYFLVYETRVPVDAKPKLDARNY